MVLTPCGIIISSVIKEVVAGGVTSGYEGGVPAGGEYRLLSSHVGRLITPPPHSLIASRGTLVAQPPTSNFKILCLNPVLPKDKKVYI